VACSAGLVVAADNTDETMPVADALADPLSGVAAAVAATAALRSQEAQLIDVSMLHVAAGTALAERPEHEVFRRGDAWWVEYGAGAVPVLAPKVRGAA
jgi:crotonobetainyl-CoA:carnitine CoA-transferase CaiB-like acyl-CoA transferase